MEPTTTTSTESLFEELDYREVNGIEVSLLWNRVDNSLSVHVFDARRGQCLEFAVGAKDALDAFKHPYAYAAFRGAAPEPASSIPERELSLH